MQLIDSLVTQAASLAALRRDIHAHPELCFQEQRTSDLVATKLTEWGIPILRGLGTTGVVGILKAGTSTRAIGLRADMDALPMQEANTFAHASTYPGKMHACGHDGHTAMLLAAAQHLATHRSFDGTVYLIFQPAEEGGGGAREMIKDGLFERFPMEAAKVATRPCRTTHWTRCRWLANWCKVSKPSSAATSNPLTRASFRSR